MLWTSIGFMEDLAWVMVPADTMRDQAGLPPSSTIILEVTEQDNSLHVQMFVNDEPVLMK